MCGRACVGRRVDCCAVTLAGHECGLMLGRWACVWACAQMQLSFLSAAWLCRSDLTQPGGVGLMCGDVWTDVWACVGLIHGHAYVPKCNGIFPPAARVRAGERMVCINPLWEHVDGSVEGCMGHMCCEGMCGQVCGHLVLIARRWFFAPRVTRDELSQTFYTTAFFPSFPSSSFQSTHASLPPVSPHPDTSLLPLRKSR